MKTYERICPICGFLNRRLYLEETGGLMECVRCGAISERSRRRNKTPKNVLMETGSNPGLEWPGAINILENPDRANTSASCLA